MLACAVLIFLAPSTLRIDLEEPAGPNGARVVLLRDGVSKEEARVAPKERTAVFRGVQGSYDAYAQADGFRSALVRGLRASEGPVADSDAILRLEPAFPVAVRGPPGTEVWIDGRWSPIGDRVPVRAGLRRLRFRNPDRTVTEERWVRVAGGGASVRVAGGPGVVLAGSVAVEAERQTKVRVSVYADGRRIREGWTSGADGTFSFGGVVGNVLTVRAIAPGFGAVHRRVLLFPDERRGAVDLSLRPGSGVATPGFAVLPTFLDAILEEPRLRSNVVPHEGFRSLVPGRAYRILGTMKNGAIGSSRPFAAPTANATVQVRAFEGPGSSIQGRCAPRTTVVLDVPEGLRRGRCDRHGKFLFTGLRAGTYRLWPRGHRRAARTVEVGPGADVRLALETPPVPSPLKKPAVAEVLDQEGRPLPGILVIGPGGRVRTDDTGRFRPAAVLGRGTDAASVTLLPARGSRALVEDPHLPEVVKLRWDRAAKVQMRRAHALLLRLDFGEERPPAGGVTLFLKGTSGVARRVLVADPGAPVSVEELPAGNYLVEVAARGFVGTGGARVVLPPKADAKGPARIQVRRGRTFRGKLVREVPAPRGLQKKPVPRGWVALFNPAPWFRGTFTPVEENGSFELRGLPPEPVLICACGPGLVPILQVVDLSSGDVENGTLSIPSPAVAEIRVTDSEGAPVPDATVRLETADGVDLRDLVARARFLGVFSDDRDASDLAALLGVKRLPGGVWRAERLAPDSYVFEVRAAGFQTSMGRVRALIPGRLDSLTGLRMKPEDVRLTVVLEPEDKGR